MTDTELRTLERAVAASNAPSDRLAYARALERAGLRDEALATLTPGLTDPLVRRELGRFPRWSRAESGPYGARFADVRPLTRAPRELWRWAAPGSARGDLQLLASPLGAVVTLTVDRADGPHRATILSPDGTPVRSWNRERSAAPLALEGAHVLDPRAAGLFAIDPVTGDETLLLDSSNDRLTAEAACARSLAIVPEGDDLSVLELEGDSLVPRWKLPWPRSAVFRVSRHTTATATRVYVSAPGFGRGGVFTAYDRATGDELWRGQRLLAADDAGALGLEEGVVAWTPDGARLWKTERATLTTLHALTPEHAWGEWGEGEGAGHPVLIERTSGSARSRSHSTRELLVARDRLHFVQRESDLEREVWPGTMREVIVALAPDGSEEWRYALEWERGVILALAPAPGRLYVLTSESSVLCLADADAPAPPPP